MKCVYISILLTFFGINISSHGGHAAVFIYNIEPTSIALEFQIENSVLEHINFQQKCVSYKSASALCLFQYLRDHAIVENNGSQIEFILENSRQENGFFIIKMSALGDFLKNKQLEIRNTSFYEFDRKFKNRIVIGKNALRKSYLLSRKKSMITVNLRAF